MAHPKGGYYLDGKRIPGTTTIIGRFKDSGALIRWAWKEGKEGRELYAKRDEAGEIGIVAHSMVEYFLDGKEPKDALEDLPEQHHDKAAGSFSAFLNWWNQTKVKVVAQEINLVSSEYRFGGTPDAIGEINGELCLLDWKTSNGVYPDFLVQLAAYRRLWDENNPHKPLTGGNHLLRFAKEHGDFHHHYFPDLSEAWEQFTLFRRAYEIDKQLKKRV